MKNVQIFEYATFSSQIREGEPTGRWMFLGYSYGILKELRTAHAGKGVEIPLGDELDRSCAALRQPFVDYVGSLATAEGPHPSIYSGLVERVPFRSHVFLDICLIDAALRKIRAAPGERFTVISEHRGLAYDLLETILSAGDLRPEFHVRGSVQSLQEKLATAAKVVLHAGKISAQLLHRRGTGSPVSITDAGNGLVILHTWVAQASIASGTYREMFFGDLREHLRSAGQPVVLMPHVPYDVSFPGTLGALEQQQVPSLSEESSLSIQDIIAVFFTTVTYWPRREQHTLAGIAFSHAAYTQAFCDWRDLQVLVPSVSERVIRGMKARKIPVKELIFTYENNAWEKAFVKTMRECYPGAVCVGYQHSTATPDFLYYYLPRSGIEQQFLPDRIVTNGEYPASFLKRNHFPADRVVAGGALRYGSGIHAAGASLESQKNPRRIVVTPPGIVDEAAEILEKFFDATRDLTDLDVVVKIHPFLPRSRIEERLAPRLVARIRYEDRPVNELLSDAGLLVYSTTSTCIEALSAGVPVLRIRSELRLDFDPLADFRGLTPFISDATQPEDIRTAILRARELRLTVTDRDTIRRIVTGIFGPVDKQTYWNFIPGNIPGA